ncbi:MAG: Cof-type HAD-IIB family hydrolase [Janthinobacterium lividum]
MPQIKLFLADVDGTLVTKEKVLTERAIAAVHRLEGAGIRFAVTSGRPPRGMAMLVEPLKLQGIIAGFNGGVYVNPDQSVVLSRTLDPGAARKAYDAIRDHGLDAWVYTAEDWMIRDPKAPHVDREAHTVQFGPKVVDDPATGLDRAVKIVGVGDDLALVEKCEGDVQRALGNTVSAARSQPYYLDVTHPDANKGAVVAYLAEHYGISPHEIATIGDMPNDVLMFKPSGMSIAMGQSSQEVRDAATHVTDGYEDEGFAKGVERFVFGDPA